MRTRKYQTARRLHFVSMSLLLLLSLAVPAFAQSSQRGDGLRGVRSWGYHLQGLDLEVLAASPYDVLVIDYSRDGTEDQRLTAADLTRLKQKPDGSTRRVLAYLSIGEAESYRYYWRWTWGGTWYTGWLRWIFGPSWLGPVNGDWYGNYAVRYWDEGWQSILLREDGYLNRIIASGFDGVYLDKIDSSIEDIADGRSNAKQDMRELVRRIADHGRKARPGFLVVPQNGEELLSDGAYRDIIDGLGKEDLLYGEVKNKRPNPESVIAKRAGLLKLLTDEGKPVLAVEYIDNPSEIAAARERLTELGLVPHFASRELDHLRVGDLPTSSRTSKSRTRRAKPE